MKKFLLWAFVVIVVVLGAVYFVRNQLVAKAIEKGSTYALGVNAHLGSADLAIGAGSLQLNDYVLDNPEGYETKEFMSIKFGILDISSGSVFSDTVVVDSLILDGINVSLIQRGDKGNFVDIMNFAKTVKFDTTSGTTLIRIDKVGVRNIAVDASLKILNQVNVEKSFTIEDITLTNVGGGKGATIGEVASIIFQEIMKKAVIKGRGQLSDQFGKGVDKLEKGVIDKVGEETVEKVKDLGSSLFGGDKK